jgi:hypothetical protein
VRGARGGVGSCGHRDLPLSLDYLLTDPIALEDCRSKTSSHVTAQEVEKVVEETVASFPHYECRICDCFQGFLVQLEIDSTTDVSRVVSPHKVPRGIMHSCLGCDPCPPGAAFSEYLRERQDQK